MYDASYSKCANLSFSTVHVFGIIFWVEISYSTNAMKTAHATQPNSIELTKVDATCVTQCNILVQF